MECQWKACFHGHRFPHPETEIFGYITKEYFGHPCTMVTIAVPTCGKFSLTYSCTCLELFPRGQSMQVHDLAKNEWILFTARKWMQSTHGNSGL
jgi:hypothetical protein